MTHRTFVAFSSADPVVADVIEAACAAARSDAHDFTPWNNNDASGQPIDRSVHGWVETADALVADISEPNHNVTYEVGLGPRQRYAAAAHPGREQRPEAAGRDRPAA